MIDDDWVSIESGNLFEKRKFRNNKVVEKQTELKTVNRRSMTFPPEDTSTFPTTSPTQENPEPAACNRRSRGSISSRRLRSIVPSPSSGGYSASEPRPPRGSDRTARRRRNVCHAVFLWARMALRTGDERLMRDEGPPPPHMTDERRRKKRGFGKRKQHAERERRGGHPRAHPVGSGAAQVRYHKLRMPRSAHHNIRDRHGLRDDDPGVLGGRRDGAGFDNSHDPLDHRRDLLFVSRTDHAAIHGLQAVAEPARKVRRAIHGSGARAARRVRREPAHRQHALRRALPRVYTFAAVKRVGGSIEHRSAPTRTGSASRFAPKCAASTT